MTAENISILLFSDTHIGFDYPLTKKHSKAKKRGHDFFNNFKLIIDKAIELNVDYVVHCGDVFEKKNIPAFLIDKTYAEFLKLANTGIQVLIVPGNHERSQLPTSLFLNHPNIYLFDSLKTFSFQGLSISGFPFYRGNVREIFPSFLKQLDANANDENFNILCVHHAIDGVKAGYHNFEFRNRPDTLDINDLPGGFDLILSGHIHKHQILQTKSRSNQLIPIIYSGSTERTMFDEINEVKGFHTIHIQGKKFEHQFYPITTKAMYKIDLKSELMSEEELKKYLDGEFKTIEKNAIVQIHSDQENILFLLSKMKTNELFPDQMNIKISGFHSLKRKN